MRMPQYQRDAELQREMENDSFSSDSSDSSDSSSDELEIPEEFKLKFQKID